MDWYPLSRAYLNFRGVPFYTWSSENKLFFLHPNPIACNLFSVLPVRINCRQHIQLDTYHYNGTMSVGAFTHDDDLRVQRFGYTFTWDITSQLPHLSRSLLFLNVKVRPPTFADSAKILSTRNVTLFAPHAKILLKNLSSFSLEGHFSGRSFLHFHKWELKKIHGQVSSFPRRELLVVALPFSLTAPQSPAIQLGEVREKGVQWEALFHE